MAHRARELRGRLNLTQEELSERSGVSRNMIQNIERGHATGKPGDPTNPTLKTLYSLSYALEVPPAVLLPDLATTVQQRSPSAATSPNIEEILRIDIVWPKDLNVELPE
ncbi:MAG TPA: helix-turn-helix transcriptional regulator [Corynebacterium sp.]|nr:helix-turn-helix transcriptional regulator [Corynebacterium sp.]